MLSRGPQERRRDTQIEILYKLATEGNRTTSQLSKKPLNKYRTNYVKSIQVLERLDFVKQIGITRKKGIANPYRITDKGLEILSVEPRITLDKFWEIMFKVYDGKKITTKISFEKYFSNYEQNVLKIKLEKIPTFWSVIMENMMDIYPKPLEFDTKLFILYVLATQKDLSFKEIKKQFEKYKNYFTNSKEITEKIVQGMISERLVIKNKSKFQISIIGLILFLNYLDERNLNKNDKQIELIDVKRDLKLILSNAKRIIPYFSKLCFEIPRITERQSILNYFRYIFNNSTKILYPIQRHGTKELVVLGRIMDDVNREKISHVCSIGYKVQDKLIHEKEITHRENSPIYSRLKYLAKISGSSAEYKKNMQEKIETEIDQKIETALRNKIDFELVCHFLPNIHDWKRIDSSFQKDGHKINFGKKNIVKWEKFLKKTPHFKKWFNSEINQIIEFEKENMNKIKTELIFNL